ncbi:hypothetical protein EJ02DRAFT_466832 [Clathrospora elynae]|uniref:EH domain-containing protein n=1 Tax=Clathrospora elynae TaxID=706981 RepID=A0A6A5SNT9_9PLEO|nr:hypothetical protein EJ02DRAFT_466832 [Clathrospora elynae]
MVPSSSRIGLPSPTPPIGARASISDNHTASKIAMQLGTYPSTGFDSKGRPGAHMRSSSQPLLEVADTPGSIAVSRTTSLSEIPSYSALNPALTKVSRVGLPFLTPEQQTSYEQLFKSAVGDSTMLSTVQVQAIFTRSKLPKEALEKIWDLVFIKGSSGLLCPQFCLAVHLRAIALRGTPLPTQLPESIKNTMRQAVNAIIREKMKAGKPVTGFPSVSEGYDMMDMASSREASIDPRRSTVDACYALSEPSFEGDTSETAYPPLYSELVNIGETPDTGDGESFERICLDTRMEEELNIRAILLSQPIEISEADWVPASPLRAPPLPLTFEKQTWYPSQTVSQAVPIVRHGAP